MESNNMKTMGQNQTVSDAQMKQDVMQNQNMVNAQTGQSVADASRVAQEEMAESMQEQKRNAMSQMASGKQTSGNGMKLALVFASIIAVCGVAFGVYGMMQSSSKDRQISDLKVQVQNNDGTVTTIETPKIETTTEGGTTVTITDTVVTNESTDDYIYVGQWGLKIKKPDNLTITGYKYSMLAGHTTVDVFGNTKGGQYFPGFADLSMNNSALGTVARYPKGAEMPLASSPSLVFSDEQYDYYYYHPQAVTSTDESEKQWEVESVNTIEQMLNNKENYSEI